MRELLWDEMNAVEARWTIEKRFRVVEVFLAVLVSKCSILRIERSGAVVLSVLTFEISGYGRISQDNSKASQFVTGDIVCQDKTNANTFKSVFHPLTLPSSLRIV